VTAILDFLFWLFHDGAVTIFGIAAVFGAVAVVVSQNVARMAFWLILSLGSTAGLFFALNADFVGATQILIYVGGTLVLLIFGVMLTASSHILKITSITRRAAWASAFSEHDRTKTWARRRGSSLRAICCRSRLCRCICWSC
jgi:hypothetical protein